MRSFLGSVARNVAENLARLGTEPILITAVGDDPEGHRLLEETATVGVNTEHCLIIPYQPTGFNLAVLDEMGNLLVGVDDMRVISGSAHRPRSSITAGLT